MWCRRRQDSSILDPSHGLGDALLSSIGGWPPPPIVSRISRHRDTSLRDGYLLVMIKYPHRVLVGTCWRSLDVGVGTARARRETREAAMAYKTLQRHEHRTQGPLPRCLCPCRRQRMDPRARLSRRFHPRAVSRRARRTPVQGRVICTGMGGKTARVGNVRVQGGRLCPVPPRCHRDLRILSARATNRHLTESHR